MIGILDYGSGNVRAIGNIFDRSRISYSILKRHTDFDKKISKIILPGVGAFDQTMSTLLKSGLKEILNDLVIGNQIPVLGICVGMQILSEGSEEGDLPGLGWINGRVRRFNQFLYKEKPKLPHLGWNSIKEKKQSPLLTDIDMNEGFYFIHSYYFECQNEQDVLTTTYYGKEFASAINSSNIYGTQFHPEKSHTNGIRLLLNFANL